MIFFPYSLPNFSDDLPLTLISLEEWSLITVYGKDTIKYLQSQFTCDMNLLVENQFLVTAHCNSRGKMFSNLYVFYHNNQVSYIERNSISNNQLIELKKYAIFSKVTIELNNNIILLGIAGSNAKIILQKLFDNIPNMLNTVTHNQNTTIIYFHKPKPRFLLITDILTYNTIFKKLSSQMKLNNSKQWLSLDIEANYPIIDLINSVRFIPQAINFNYLSGISFSKGCYIGQEAISRIEHRGVNKLSMYYFKGRFNNHIPVAGDNLEIKLNNSWKKTGVILASCKLIDNHICIQAVLNKNLINNSFRICNDNNSILYIRN